MKTVNIFLRLKLHWLLTTDNLLNLKEFIYVLYSPAYKEDRITIECVQKKDVFQENESDYRQVSFHCFQRNQEAQTSICFDGLGKICLA